jgi:hypothetical protein
MSERIRIDLGELEHAVPARSTGDPPTPPIYRGVPLGRNAILPFR